MHLSDGELKQLLIDSGAVKAEVLNDLLTPRPGAPATLESLESLVIKNRLITQDALDQLYAKTRNVPITPVPLSVPTNAPVALVPAPALKGPPPSSQPAKPKAKSLPSAPKVAASPTDEASIAKTINVIIEYAVKSRASDIHLEPREKIVQVRYRIDGILHETMTLPKAVLGALVAHVKALAKLKADEQHLPQEGRFNFSLGERTLVLRVSILPVIDGEKIVMRLVDEQAKALTLEELGLSGESLARVARGIHQPHGLVLVTGPAGSGKTTTLYSLLTLVDLPGVNISTIEDPVEYRLPGVNQTQVELKTGMTLAAGLRSLLSQDPNIILVSELRDSETAGLSVQTALTGHLVMSALHADNAATALTRLLDMGIESFLVASTVKLVIAQRLARRLCSNCRVGYVPTGESLTAIKHDFQLAAALKLFRGDSGTDTPKPKPVTPEHAPITPTGKLKVIQPEHTIEGSSTILDRIKLDPNIINRSLTEADAKRQEQNQPTPPPTTPDQPPPPADPGKLEGDQFLLYRAGPGCDQCNHNGYLGRIGIYEVLEMDELVSKMVVSRGRPDMIEEGAERSGMISMQQDGLLKCLEGLTTVEEILRVTREFDR